MSCKMSNSVFKNPDSEKPDHALGMDLILPSWRRESGRGKAGRGRGGKRGNL